MVVRQTGRHKTGLYEETLDPKRGTLERWTVGTFSREPETVRVSSDQYGRHEPGDILSGFFGKGSTPIEVPEAALSDGILDAADHPLDPGRSKVVSRQRQHDRASRAEIQDQMPNILAGGRGRFRNVKPFVYLIIDRQTIGPGGGRNELPGTGRTGRTDAFRSEDFPFQEGRG